MRVDGAKIQKVLPSSYTTLPNFFCVSRFFDRILHKYFLCVYQYLAVVLEAQMWVVVLEAQTWVCWLVLGIHRAVAYLNEMFF